MIRAHRIRLNPTEEQEKFFWQCAGIARFTWNWALAEYNNALARGAIVTGKQIGRAHV